MEVGLRVILRGGSKGARGRGVGDMELEFGGFYGGLSRSHNTCTIQIAVTTLCMPVSWSCGNLDSLWISVYDSAATLGSPG